MERGGLCCWRGESEDLVYAPRKPPCRRRSTTLEVWSGSLWGCASSPARNVVEENNHEQRHQHKGCSELHVMKLVTCSTELLSLSSGSESNYTNAVDMFMMPFFYVVQINQTRCLLRAALLNFNFFLHKVIGSLQSYVFKVALPAHQTVTTKWNSINIYPQLIKRMCTFLLTGCFFIFSRICQSTDCFCSYITHTGVPAGGLWQVTVQLNKMLSFQHFASFQPK